MSHIEVSKLPATSESRPNAHEAKRTSEIDAWFADVSRQSFNRIRCGDGGYEPICFESKMAHLSAPHDVSLRDQRFLLAWKRQNAREKGYTPSRDTTPATRSSGTKIGSKCALLINGLNSSSV
jgi:hypothetical protein